MMTLELLLAAAMGATAMALAMRHGVLAPSSLGALHLLIGVSIKGLYEKYLAADDATLLAPWVLVPSQLPVLELQLLAIASGLLLLSMPRPPLSVPTCADGPTTNAAIRSVAAFCWLCMAIALVLIAWSLGGLSAAARTLSSRVSESVAGLAWMFVFGDLAVVSSLFVYALGRASSMRTRSVVLLTVVTPLISVLYLAFLGGRGNLLQYVLSVMIIRQATSQRRSAGPWALVGFACAAPIVLVAGLVTRTMNQYGQTLGEALAQVPGTLVEMALAPFALIDHYALSEIYASERGHHFGVEWLLLPLKFVPRSVWAEKDVPLAIAMREHFWGDSLGGIPPGLFGEGVMGLGLVGALCSVLILVLSVRALMRLALVRGSSIAHVALYAVLTPYVAFNLIRGGLDVAFVRIVIQGAVGIAMVFWINRVMCVRGARDAGIQP